MNFPPQPYTCNLSTTLCLQWCHSLVQTCRYISTCTPVACCGSNHRSNWRVSGRCRWWSWRPGAPLEPWRTRICHLMRRSSHGSASVNSAHTETTDYRTIALLTTLPSSLRCQSHTSAEQYSKTRRTKLQEDIRRSDRSWNTCQDFLMILILCGAALETERRCYSKVILASKVAPNVTRLSYPFMSVPSRVYGVYWGWIIVLA